MRSSSSKIQLQTLILILVSSTSLGSPVVVSDGIRASADASSSMSASASCPAGWRRWKDEKCILYHSSDVDYETGERNCQSIGARLVTITSAEEEDFVISLLKQARVEKEAAASSLSGIRSNAFYFWIDSTSAVKGMPPSSSNTGLRGTTTTSLGAAGSSSRCPVPTALKSNSRRNGGGSGIVSSDETLCPAKVVKISGNRKVFWCYFDCYKQQVDAICEIVIRKKAADLSGIPVSGSITGKRKTTTRKRDISSSNTNNENSLLMPSSTDEQTSSSPEPPPPSPTLTVVPSSSTSTTSSPLPPPTSTSTTTTTSAPPSATSSSSPSPSSSSSDLTTAASSTTESSSSIASAAYDCEVGWKLHHDKCYKSIQMDTNGQEAKNLCQFRDSAHLTSIMSSGVQEVIATLVSGAKEPFNRPLLIDGRYDRSSRTFRWSETNQPFRYTNWGPGQPDLFDKKDDSSGNNDPEDGEICVAIDTSRNRSHPLSSWITIPCMETANVLCSKPGRLVGSESSDSVSTTGNTLYSTTTSAPTSSSSSSSSTVDPVAPVAGDPCQKQRSGGGEKQEHQEVTFDPAAGAMITQRCNESVDNGKGDAAAAAGKASSTEKEEEKGSSTSASAGRNDVSDDDRREKMEDQDRQVPSGSRDEKDEDESRSSHSTTAASASAGEGEEAETTNHDNDNDDGDGDGKKKKSAELRESGTGSRNNNETTGEPGNGVKSSATAVRKGADAAIVNNQGNENNEMRSLGAGSSNNRGLTASGSLTLSILIIVLAGILMTVCFLVRTRGGRRGLRGRSSGAGGGNGTKVISLQRSQHDSNIYFDKSPVTAIDTAVHEEGDEELDHDVALFDKLSLNNKS